MCRKEEMIKKSAEWNADLLPILPESFIQYEDLEKKINRNALIFKITKVQII